MYFRFKRKYRKVGNVILPEHYNVKKRKQKRIVFYGWLGIIISVLVLFILIDLQR